jgi:hypothetical protein
MRDKAMWRIRLQRLTRLVEGKNIHLESPTPVLKRSVRFSERTVR